VALCIPAEVPWCFRGMYCLHLHGQSKASCLLLDGCLLELLFAPEDGGSMFLRNISKLLLDYTASHTERYYSSVFIKYCSTFLSRRLLFNETASVVTVFKASDEINHLLCTGLNKCWLISPVRQKLHSPDISPQDKPCVPTPLQFLCPSPHIVQGTELLSLILYTV
jgi:hypothetical protein